MASALPSPVRAAVAIGTPSRIARNRHRMQDGHAYLSVERARYYTESWQATEGRERSQAVRVAVAMRHVFANMTHHVEADDRIAGYWTEYFLGLPIDIERGVFNSVVETELSKWSMAALRVKSTAKTISYLHRNHQLRSFLAIHRAARASGGRLPLDFELKTMPERKINPFQIKAADRRELLKKLLPYWKGKSLADRLEQKLDASGLRSVAMRQFSAALPGNTSRQAMMVSSCATIATIQGHLVLDYDSVLKHGLREIASQIRERAADSGLTRTQREYLRAAELSVEGVLTFATRLAIAIEHKLAHALQPAERDNLREVLAICQRVPEHPPRTFREAVQAMWTVKTAVELAHPVNLHCFGRLDQQLYPFYRNDLAAGRITEEEAQQVVEELLLKVMSQNMRPESNVLSHFYHRFLGSAPITLAGLKPDGTDATNELTYLFLRAAHTSKAITNVSVRVSSKTPEQVLLDVADYLRQGTSSYSLFCDEVNIEAMQRRGFAVEDARDYAVMGCVETTCPGKTGSMSANALLLSRVLDITLRGGAARTLVGTLEGEGIRDPAPEQLRTFDDFLASFLGQARYAIDKIASASNLRDRLYAESLPAPYVSAFTQGCLANARDVTQGGATYDLAGISMINSIANVTDSLYVIKKLIFESKSLDFATLQSAVDDNFVGYPELLTQIQGLSGKWGNGNPETDALASKIMQALCDLVHGHRSYKDGPFVTFAISMTTHTIDGRMSIASPDGRRAATPYAASANPYNVERNGILGVLRSVAALPGRDMMGCAVNARFHPTSIGRTESARRKWAALMRTYFRLGGSQLQPTAASVEVLRDAQRRPESHRDLIVKVGGYSSYFVELGDEIQNEIIARTEHG